jgi:hypothetical protein
MSSYISSNANRWYCAIENGFGQVPAITAANRIPAVKLNTKVELETAERKDKTGSRTFAGTPVGGRQKTTFDLTTYMVSNNDPSVAPAYGPLFQAAMGGTPLLFRGGTASSTSNNAGQLGFTSAHGLLTDQAVTYNGELRFVAAIIDANTVQLNAPFSTVPSQGTAVGATVTYNLASTIPSVSVLDYWTPATALQRILSGAAVDELSINLNGDYHEFHFQGIARDLIDSVSFENSSGGLSSFPTEPIAGATTYGIVPGNLGQVWLGSSPSKFLTVTSGQINLRNDLVTRSKEFGSSLPAAVIPGPRKVTLDVDLYGYDDAATVELYQAARQRSPISAAFQLGQAQGQLAGIYLKSVVPEVPEFDDSDRRLQWRFKNSRAQGTNDDEMVVAFG